MVNADDIHTLFHSVVRIIRNAQGGVGRSYGLRLPGRFLFSPSEVHGECGLHTHAVPLRCEVRIIPNAQGGVGRSYGLRLPGRFFFSPVVFSPSKVHGECGRHTHAVPLRCENHPPTNAQGGVGRS